MIANLYKFSQPTYHYIKRYVTRFSYQLCRILNIEPTPRMARWSPDYTTILALARSDIAENVTPSPQKGHVLFFTSAAAFPNLVALELALHRMLQQRGYQTDALMCDQYMDLCDVKNHHQTPQGSKQICKRCILRGRDTFEAVRIAYKLASDEISPDVRETLDALEAQIDKASFDELQSLTVDNIPVGTIACASALRYLRRGTWPRPLNGNTTEVLRGFVRSASRIKFLAESYLARNPRPDFVVMTHGIYVSWGPALAVFRREGIPVACYDQSSVFKGAFVASWNQPSQAYDIAEAFERERNQALSLHERNILTEYLMSRRENSRDRTRFNTGVEETRDITRERLGVPSNALCFGIFTNLLWDAATVARSSCFENQIAWVSETIKYFEARPHEYLILRAHPAERLRGTSQAILDEIMMKYPILPPNVKVVTNEMQLNAYSLYNAIDVGIVNTSTVGLELSLMSKPVIVVSETHYAGKGFTFEPLDRIEYFKLLKQFIPGYQLDKQKSDEAARYAYTFFFRHHVQLGIFIENEAGTSIIQAKLTDRTTEGIRTAWIDALIHQKPFLIPRELVSV